MRLIHFAWIAIIPTLLFAEILETDQIRDVERYADTETLVIFDIDNTLIEPAQMLGTDQWFHYRIEKYQDEGLNFENALEKALAEWMSVQNVTKVKLVEPCAAECVASLQGQKITVMGLTTRGLGLSTRTIEQLKSVNIDLNKTTPTKEEFHFMNGQGVLFRKGILFTAGSHKGAALEKFLNHTKIKPKQIVFINDKESHIKPLEEYCLINRIPFIGLRYSYLDDKVQSLNPDIVEIQWSHFGHILSDEGAKRILDYSL